MDSVTCAGLGLQMLGRETPLSSREPGGADQARQLPFSLIADHCLNFYMVRIHFGKRKKEKTFTGTKA